ncbi:hypothetical protein [Oceanospirillum beijerinckii]|uniref:hypothetical protein n=1 Tax=Oceanospirillum beijerinckii TaxID=64976 RepID=UPI0004190453|nr:hypothetical protein [Oceanospirillum beijerinckii]
MEKVISVKKINLDKQNPRHGRLSSELEIIDFMIENEQIKNLAKDIVAKKGLNPFDNIGVIPDPSQPDTYFVAEGNRRICSLKLLLNPEKANNEKNINFFANLAEEIDPPITELKTIVFDSRESVNQWIKQRHVGQQNGIGVKDWDARQSSRFDGRSSPNALSDKLLEYAAKRQILLKEQVKKIAITTITRFLNNTHFRKTIGIQEKKDLIIWSPQNEFDPIIKRFLHDVLDSSKKDVSSRSNAETIEDYADNLIRMKIAPATRLAKSDHINLEDFVYDSPDDNPYQAQKNISPNSAPFSPDESQNSTTDHETLQTPLNTSGNTPQVDPEDVEEPIFADDNQNKESTTQASSSKSDHQADISPSPLKPRNNQNPRDRKYIIPSSFKAKIRDKTLKRIFDELTEIEAGRHTFATSYLMRAFIENLFAIYLKKKTGNAPEQLHKKIDQTAKRLVNDGKFKDQDVKYLRIMLTSDHPHSANSLGYVIHGGAIPTKDSMLALWDSLEKIIETVLKEIK